MEHGEVAGSIRCIFNLYLTMFRAEEAVGDTVSGNPFHGGLVAC